MRKRLLSLLLALTLCLSLVVPALASEKPSAAEAKGYRSIAFQQNQNRYHDDDVVRVIVTLAAQPTVLTAGTQAEAQAAQARREQAGIQRAMDRKGVAYTVQHTFDTLLNGFSCDVAYGDLDRIAALSGVDAVYIANSYSVPTVLAGEQIQMSFANATTGADQLRAAGYDGRGMVVAVLDTGLNTTHEAFRSNETMEETAALTGDDLEAADVPGKYLSAKVPFAYDYADWDDDVTDNVGHGTHVSGTIVGLTEDEDGTISFSGVAPYAQLLSMKIFSDYEGSTSTDIYFQAMEDAYKLGADVINLSIGAQNGFTYDEQLETELGQTIFQRLSAAGVILSVAGGNQYSMDYYSSMGYTGAEYQDYGTIASPATYDGSTSVAAMENLKFPTTAFAIDGIWHAYFDNCRDGEHGWLDTFGEEELSYVIVPDREDRNPLNNGVSLGYAEDFEGIDLDGKIAVVQRGDINYADKVFNAAQASAAGCLVVNTESTNEAAMTLDEQTIPAVLTTVETLDALQSSETQTLRNSYSEQMVPNANGGKMSDFSNWGTSPDLTMDPVITSIGGMVYSALIGGDSEYVIYSGTSMAAPNFSGAALLTMQYLQKAGITDQATQAELALTLLEGTAVPVRETEQDYYSVRKQGAGMANSWNAAHTYETSAYLVNPIHELGDDPEETGEYTVTLEFTNENTAERDVIYQFETVLQCSDAADGKNTLTTRTLEQGVDYTVSCADSLTVKHSETASATVTLTLTDTAKAWLGETFPNGTYIEGYIFAKDVQDDTVYGTVHASLLAYYGDWAKAPVAETVDYADYLDAEYAAFHDGADIEHDNIFAYLQDDAVCYTRPNMALTATFVGGEPDMPTYYLGGNLYDINYETVYDPAHNAMSTVEADGSTTSSHGIYVTLSQLRNLTSVTMTITDAEDESTVYYTQTQKYLSKCYYDKAWFPADIFWWDGCDSSGEMVPSGTKVNVRFDGVLPWNDTAFSDLWNFQVEVDYEAPYVSDTVYDEESGTLTVTAADESYLASVLLKNEYGDILDVKVIPEPVEGEEATVTFDVSWMVESDMRSVEVVAVDYATNESWGYSAPLYETGKDATITLVTPAGTEAYPAVTGDYFELPEPEPVEGFRFICWTDHEIEREEDFYAVYPNYEAFDYVEVSGDASYYAVYAKGEMVPYDPALFCVPDDLYDFSGTFALVGLNTDEDGYLLTADPQVLNETGATVDAVDTYGAVTTESEDDYSFTFRCNEQALCFEIVPDEDGCYSIQSSVTGQYLAIGESNTLVFTDTPNEAALWTIEPAWEGNVVVRSYLDEDFGIGYNEESGMIVLYDDTMLVDTGDWGELPPSEWYYLWLYRRTTEAFEAEYYTTKPVADEPEEPVKPIEPDRPVVPGQLMQPQAGPFTDVSSSHKAYQAICYLYERRIMDGLGGNRFAPDSTLTRAMVMTILYRLDGETPVAFSGLFSDVASGLWYSDAVEWAAACGIVNGVGGGRFDPDGAITREQLAAILQRYAAYQELDTTASTRLSETAAVSDWARSNVQWAVALNLLEGGTAVNAAATANRAEVALAVYGFILALLH